MLASDTTLHTHRVSCVSWWQVVRLRPVSACCLAAALPTWLEQLAQHPVRLNHHNRHSQCQCPPESPAKFSVAEMGGESRQLSRVAFYLGGYPAASLGGCGGEATSLAVLGGHSKPLKNAGIKPSHGPWHRACEEERAYMGVHGLSGRFCAAGVGCPRGKRGRGDRQCGQDAAAGNASICSNVAGSLFTLPCHAVAGRRRCLDVCRILYSRNRRCARQKALSTAALQGPCRWLKPQRCTQV